MAVEGVNSAYYSSTASANEKRQVGDELGKDAFLQILVAQMANQDPLSPTSDTEFIAQMAQFSSLEQMQNLNTSMSTQAAYSYMGKDVTAENAMDAEGNLYAQNVYGTVTGVSHMNGGNYLQVKDYATGETVLVAPDQVLQTINNASMENQILAMMSQILSNSERSATAAEAAAAAALMNAAGSGEADETVTEETDAVTDAGEASETVGEDDAADDNAGSGATGVEGGGEAAPEDSAAL